MKHKMLNESLLNENIKLTEDDLNPYFRKDAKKQYKDYLGRTADKRRLRDEVIRDVRELGIETGKSKDVIKNAVNKTKERLAVPDFKLDKDVALERENYPYYLTVYNKGAVYEPAEGGYYVEVQFPNYSQGYDTYEEAKAELDEFISTDDENWHEVGKDAYEWEGRYVGDGQYVRLETNKNYLKAVVEYNGYESFKGHKFKSKKRPNKLRESKSPDLVWRIRNNALNYDDEREAHHGSDNKGYHVDIQDRLSNTTEFSGVKDKNGNIVGMGRKLNRQPKTASKTWGRIWKDDELVKSFEGPKYKVRGQMINYLDNDDLTEDYRYSKEELQFPEYIEVLLYPSTDIWKTYERDYVHEKGGCYYQCMDRNSSVVTSLICLYPDGHLTYLWNGRENPLNHEWRPVDKDLTESVDGNLTAEKEAYNYVINAFRDIDTNDDKATVLKSIGKAVKDVYGHFGGGTRLDFGRHSVIANGWLPTDTDKKWTAYNSFDMEYLDGDVQRFAEDVAMAVHNHKKFHYTPDLAKAIKNESISRKRLRESVGTADFTADVVEYSDEDGTTWKVLETVPVTVAEIEKAFGKGGYKAGTKDFTKEMIKDGIGKNWTIGTQIESVAQKKFESKRPYRSKYGIGVENIQVVNDDLFDTSERLLQKKLGKLLLPPEGWTGRNK